MYGIGLLVRTCKHWITVGSLKICLALGSCQRMIYCGNATLVLFNILEVSQFIHSFIHIRLIENVVRTQLNIRNTT